MFETADHAEIQIPVPLRADGERVWSYVEFPLHVPWFHLVYRFPLEGGSYLKRSLFLSEVAHLLRVSEQGLYVEEVQVVLPKHITGADRWIMEPLTEIWEGIEYPDTGQKAFVYVVGNGKRYLDSGLCKSEQELKQPRVIYKTLARHQTTPPPA